MNILITSPLYPPETAEIAEYTKKLAEKLAKNHRITLVVYSNRELKENNFSLLSIRKNQSAWKRISSYYKVIKQEIAKNDIIFLQSGISASLPAFLAGKLAKKKIVFRYFEDEAWERAKQQKLCREDLKTFLKKGCGSLKISLIKSIQKIILKNSDIVVSANRGLAKILLEDYHCKKDKIANVPDPLQDPISLPFSCVKKPSRIYSICKPYDYQSIIDLIDIVFELKKHLKNPKLFISGRNENIPHFNKYIEQKNLSENISFIGETTKAENYYHLKTASLFIYNSKSLLPDNFLINVAFAAPAIIISRESFSLEHGFDNTIFSFSAIDKENILDTAGKILSAEINTEEKSAELKNYVITNYSWEKHLEQLETVFQKFNK